MADNSGNTFKVEIIVDDKLMEQGLKTAETNLKNFQKQVGKTGDALSSIRPGANQASNALTNLSRVAQDAPFGFIGIQNNLNPLLESFQRLKVETGSASGALKALGSSLIGAGGLGLALGLITSAIVIYQNGIAGFNKKTKEATDKSKEFLDTLKSASDITGKSSAALQGEIATVSALVGVVRNSNLAYEQRKNALDQLRNTNKAYFGDLSLEASSLATITKRVGEYTNALIAQAVVKAFAEDIGRVNKELFEQSKLLDGARTKMEQAQKSLDAFNIDLSDRRKAGLPETTSDQLEQVKLMRAVKNTTAAFIAQRGSIEDLSTNMAEMNGALQDAVANQTKLKPLTEPLDKKTPALGKTLAQIFAKIKDDFDKQTRDLNAFSDKQSDLFYSEWARQIAGSDKKQAVIDAFNRTNEAIKKGIVGIQAGGSLVPTTESFQLGQLEKVLFLQQQIRLLGKTPIDVSFLSDTGAQALLLQEQQQGIIDKFMVTGEVVTNFLQPAFQSFFDGLLSGTVSAGQLLKQFFLGIIKQIAATIAQAAALAAVLSAFGLSFGGVSGFGKLFKGFLGGGGPNFGGVGSFGGNFNVSGVLRGQDIYLSGQRGGAALGRIGGGLQF